MGHINFSTFKKRSPISCQAKLKRVHLQPRNLGFGYGSKLGTPKLWMVNTKLDIHICGPTSVFHFDPHPFNEIPGHDCCEHVPGCWNPWLKTADLAFNQSSEPCRSTKPEPSFREKTHATSDILGSRSWVNIPYEIINWEPWLVCPFLQYGHGSKSDDFKNTGMVSHPSKIRRRLLDLWVAGLSFSTQQ